MIITKREKVNIELSKNELQTIYEALFQMLHYDNSPQIREIIIKIQKEYPEWVDG